MKLSKMFLAAALAVPLTGCGGGGGGDPPVLAPPVASVTLSPLAPTMAVGDTVQLTAVAKDAGGRNLEGRKVTWSSEDTSTVSITSAGLATAIKTGSSKITARVDNKQADTTVTVREQGPQPVAVSSVEIDPVNALVAEGDNYQFSVTARDAAGKPVHGRAAHWTTGEALTALVDGGGRVTALRAGVTTVGVRVDGKSATASVRVEAHYPFELLYGRMPVGGANSLYTLDIRDPAAVAMRIAATGAGASDATASPDGTRIAYVATLPAGTAIVVADRDGSNARQLSTAPFADDQPAWSPDGERLAFRRRTAGTDIWVMDAADGGNAANLTVDHGATNESWPAWSPQLADGSVRIAYSHSQGGQGHLWTMRDDGTDKQQITSGTSAYDDQPNWSPDGSRIVFTRSDAAIFGDLYVVDASGGAGSLLMQLAGPLAGPQWAPAWSPDGRLIAFASKHAGDHYQLYTVWSDGTRLAQRTADSEDHSNPTWVGVRQ